MLILISYVLALSICSGLASGAVNAWADRRIWASILRAGSLLTLCLLVGLRGFDVGPDTSAYLFEYQHAQFYWQNQVRPSEVGFSFFNLFMSSFGFGFNVVLLVISIFTFFSFYLLSERFKINSFYYVLLLFLVGIVSFSMSGLRQFIAIGFVTLACLGFRRNRPLSLLLLMCAFIFHNSSIVFSAYFLFAWYAVERFSIRFVVILLAVFSVLLFQFHDWFLDFFVKEGVYRKQYLSESATTNFKVVGVHFFLFSTSLFIWLSQNGWINARHKLKLIGRIGLLEFIMATSVVLVPIIVTLSTEIRLIERLALYFMPFQCAYIAKQFTFSSLTRSNMMFFYSFTCMLILLVFALVLRDTTFINYRFSISG